MSWVTAIWAMIGSACFTLAVVHGLVWWRRWNARAQGLFALSAVGTGIFAGFELWMMRAQTPEEYTTAVRWSHVPLWVLIVSLVGFVQLYLQAGRSWLGWTVVGLRTLALLLNFIFDVNLNYREINSIEHIRILGEPV